jgi:hypothetical protein
MGHAGLMALSTRSPLARAAILFVMATGTLLASHPARKGHRPKPAKAAPAPGAIVNLQALEPFLQALRALETPGTDQVVRVLQFGDSHTAADYWSGQLRRRLQARFGNAGPGHVQGGKPWRGYAHEGVRLGAGPGWTARSLRAADCDGLVGLAGAALVAPETLPPEPAFTVRAAFGEARISLLGPEEARIVAAIASVEKAPSAPGEPWPEALPPQRIPLSLAEAAPLGDGLALQTFTLSGLSPAAPTELNLFLPGGSRFLGLDLRSGRPGVVYDELGLNGAELTDLERWNPSLRRLLLERAQPGLIVLAYGTNDEGLGAPDREAYATRARALIQAIREASGAPVLLVGPLDRLGRARRQRLPLKAGAEWIIQTLKATAQATGCAFWDARQAMGGYGSIQKWRRAGPVSGPCNN